MEFFNKKAEALSNRTDEMRKEPTSKINKKLLVHQMWETFCLSTNAHGFFKVAEDTKVMRKVWIFIMCITLTGLFALVFFLLQQLLSYNLNAEVEISPQNHFIMPDVTICPRQRYFFYDFSTLSPNSKPFTPNNFFFSDNLTFQKYFQKLSTFWKIAGLGSEANRSARYSILQRSQNNNLFRGQHDILIKLNYLNKNISSDEFQLLMRPDGFRCIIYRPKERKITLIDESSDLFVIVFIPPVGNDDTYEAMVQTNSEIEQLRIGSSLYIHPPMTIPEFETQELIIPRDNVVQLAIERNENFLSNINNRCQKDNKPIQIRQGNISLEFEYTESLCLNLRKQVNIYNNCGCISETLFWPLEIPQDTLFCHLIPDSLVSKIPDNNSTALLLQDPSFNVTLNKHSCHETSISNFNPSKEIGSCPIPCDTVRFGYDKSIISYRQTIKKFWPVISETLPILKKKMESLNLPTGQFEVAYNQDLGNRLCFISIKPKSMNVKVIREGIVYQLGNFFSDVGGVMGLFVGFTLITIFDLSELLIFILGFLFTEYKKKKKIDSPDVK